MKHLTTIAAALIASTVAFAQPAQAATRKITLTSSSCTKTSSRTVTFTVSASTSTQGELWLMRIDGTYGPVAVKGAKTRIRNGKATIKAYGVTSFGVGSAFFLKNPTTGDASAQYIVRKCS